MPLTPVSPEAMQTADKIRTDAEAAYSKARGDGRYNTDTVKQLLAKIYTDADTKMDALRNSARTASDDKVRAATAAAWGIDDIAGTNPVDRAAAAMSMRDAVDRASKLDTETAAMFALQQAESNGDELAARAIAQMAYGANMRDVVDAYCETRPKAAAAIAALADLTRGKLVAVDLFWSILTKPSELSGLMDYQIAALAASAPAQA